ncbi:hypothetical protein M444_01760 [Streptomyces sp. Mg1]|nr:hypothetical protein M444_01760 [Streptomyces sp. Mg1]
MGEGGRLARGVVVRRLLAVDQGLGSVSSLHVRVMAEAAGVTERTVWKRLAEPCEGRQEPVVRPTPTVPVAPSSRDVRWRARTLGSAGSASCR